VERKLLEDLIQRLWDQGASIEMITKILEHDKQQSHKLMIAVDLLREVYDCEQPSKYLYAEIARFLNKSK